MPESKFVAAASLYLEVTKTIKLCDQRRSRSFSHPLCSAPTAIHIHLHSSAHLNYSLIFLWIDLQNVILSFYSFLCICSTCPPPSTLIFLFILLLFATTINLIYHILTMISEINEDHFQNEAHFQCPPYFAIWLYSNVAASPYMHNITRIIQETPQHSD